MQILYKSKVLVNTTFLNKYYYLNDILWQEGFLIDFAQKKTADKFVRKFLIISAYLFNERLVFDKVIRIYSDVLLFVSGNKAVYDFNNIANMLLFLLAVIGVLLLTFIILFLSVWCKVIMY
jgi:hypothetical protein